METKPTDVSVELQASELESVAGGLPRNYCVYGSNGTVGVNDWNAMVSRPLAPGEYCS